MIHRVALKEANGLIRSMILEWMNKYSVVAQRLQYFDQMHNGYVYFDVTDEASAVNHGLALLKGK
jgi:hypothetical protein